jgi:hypothetical protein
LLAFDSSWDFGLQSIVVLLPYIGPIFSRSRSRGERYQVDKILKVTKREHLLPVERHRAVTVLLSPIPIVLMLTYMLVAAMLKTLHLTSKGEEGDFCGHTHFGRIGQSVWQELAKAVHLLRERRALFRKSTEQLKPFL